MNLRKAANMAIEAMIYNDIDRRKKAIIELTEALHQESIQPKRKWVGLTNDEIYEYADKFLYQHGNNYGILSFGKSIEAKLKEKNG